MRCHDGLDVRIACADGSGRVAPILKDAIRTGKINLKAIVNTHSLVLGEVSCGDVMRRRG